MNDPRYDVRITNDGEAVPTQAAIDSADEHARRFSQRLVDHEREQQEESLAEWAEEKVVNAP